MLDPNKKLRDGKLDDIYKDMKDELEKFGKILNLVVIHPHQKKMGAETGSVLVEFENLKSAEECMLAMKGRRYDKRELRISYINAEVFLNELMPKAE